MMKLHIKYDIQSLCKIVLQQQLDKLNLKYAIITFGEIDLKEEVSPEKLSLIGDELGKYGMEIIDNHKSILIQKIKDVIVEMVYMEDKLQTAKTSSYLADKLNYSYGYISNLFSEITYTSIENYIILQRVERAKQLIQVNNLTFTEIAWKLNYSSVAHFSNQFKNVTGLTPTAFQRILNKRRNPI